MTTLADMLRKARRAVRRRGARRDDVQDLVQEAFLRIEGYERAHVVRSREALLVSTAVNLSIDAARRRQRTPPHDRDQPLDLVPDGAAGPDEIIAARMMLQQVQACLEELPERTRRILLARRLDGVSYREIAEREGMSVAAVEKYIARATLTLMKRMEKR